MRIDRDALLEQARRRSGKVDFGETAFLDGLDALLAALAERGGLNEDSRIAVTERIVAPLVRRLELYDDRARHPEIPAQRIERPLVVIGLPRSGTTFLHALLAQDPEARGLLPWQIGNLSPPPRRQTIDSDPRIAATEAAMETISIEFKRRHMVGAKLPDECNSITQMAFSSANFIAWFDVPSYMRWYLADEAVAAYRLHRHVLQHLQAFTDGGHWVLKAPPHMFHMPALVQTYPDARIVFPHRDPASTLSSFASLVSYLRGQFYASVDRAAVGRQLLDIWAEAIDRVLAFRRDPARADRFVDVSYAQLIVEPMRVVRRIYDHFGMILRPEAEHAMLRFLAERPKDQHGAHHHSLEEAGLMRAEIDERFRDYLDSCPVTLRPDTDAAAPVLGRTYVGT